MLPEPVVQAMAEKAAAELLRAGAVRVADRAHLTRLLHHALTEELSVERQLHEEADRLLAEHQRAAKAQGADLAELRRKILGKLARDKGLVLR